MKILFFSRLFYPHVGGVERHVYEVSRELVERGHKVTIVTEKFDKDSAEHQEFEGMEVYRIPVGKNEWLKKFIIWRWLFRHRKLMQKADIIHCHDVFFWYLPFRFFYLTKKVYTTFHGYEGNLIPSKKAILMHKIAEKLSFGNICVGDFLQKWYGTKANYVTYGGVKIPNKASGFRKIEYGKKISVAFLGRLEDETGIMIYLRALKIAHTRGFPVQLVVLGDGTFRSEAERYCSAQKIPAVFKGFVTNIEKYLADVHFVFTSRYLGILEAMVLRKFVFAVYNNVIKKDYLRMAPFSDYISITKDEHSLAEEIVFYIQNQQVAFKMSQEGSSWVKQQPWEHMADMYLQLWSSRRNQLLGIGTLLIF